MPFFLYGHPDKHGSTDMPVYIGMIGGCHVFFHEDIVRKKKISPPQYTDLAAAKVQADIIPCKTATMEIASIDAGQKTRTKALVLNKGKVILDAEKAILDAGRT